MLKEMKLLGTRHHNRRNTGFCLVNNYGTLSLAPVNNVGSAVTTRPQQFWIYHETNHCICFITNVEVVM